MIPGTDVWFPSAAAAAIPSGPGSITRNITVGSDDGYQGPFFNDTSGTYAEQGTRGQPQMITSYFRYQNVTVPKGALITSATFNYQVTGNNTNAGTNPGVWRALASDNVTAAPTTPTSAAKTSASVSIPIAIAAASVNITAIIQEIISRSGWVAGNSLCIVGDASTAAGVVQIQCFEGTGAPIKPSITINYTV